MRRGRISARWREAGLSVSQLDATRIIFLCVTSVSLVAANFPIFYTENRPNGFANMQVVWKRFDGRRADEALPLQAGGCHLLRTPHPRPIFLAFVILTFVIKDQVCQTSDWNNHKKACQAARKAQTTGDGQASKGTSSDEPSIVKAVDLTGGYNIPFRPVAVEISSDHEIFKGKGHLSPVSKLIGQPILVYRHLQDDPFGYLVHPQRERFDNSSVTFLMIDPATGMAPAR